MIQMPTPEPRAFTAAANALYGDRMAALAARRAFVALKVAFAEAVVEITGEPGRFLQEQVRAAEEPVDLWLLRAAVFNALSGPDPMRRLQRQRLRRALEVMFPDTQHPNTDFSSL
jgi:hypothetical protein